MGLESMRIVTGCRTAEQFIAAFGRFCDAKTCFVPSVDTRPVGSALAFSLRLADGTPMLRGTCVVKAAWKTKDNPFKRPGIQLAIQMLSAESAALYEQMLAQKTAVFERNDGVVDPVPGATTNQHVPRDKAIDLILRQGNAPVVTIPTKPPPIPDRPPSSIDEQPTRRVVVAAPPEVVTAPLPTETRTPGSAIVLPANPLSGLDERALDEMLGCTLVEDPDADDLAIPVDEPPPLPEPPSREDIATLLGVAPLVPARAAPRQERKITQPLVLDARPPAPRSVTAVQAMHERFWLVYAAGLLVVAIVLTSAIVFAR